MARFRFALQPALDVARAREHAAVGRLVRARAERAPIRARLDDFRERERSLGATSASSDVLAYREAIARRRRSANASLAVADDAIAAASVELMREAGSRTTLERLRSKARAAWWSAEDLREANDLDEANASAQARNALART